MSHRPQIDRFLPSGSFRETIATKAALAASQTLTSGTARGSAIFLRAGEVITSITFLTGSTALASGNNQWFALTDASGNRVAITADDTSTAWAANAFKTLNLTSPYTVPTTGVYYLVILVNAGTPPTITASMSNASSVGTINPQASWQDTTNTGLTNPASAPTTFVKASSGVVPYAYVS